MTEPAERQAQRSERAGRGTRRRLFFALGLDDACRERLGEAASELQGPLAGLSGRALVPADWHVTLCFLGAVEEALLAPLFAQAARIEVHAFTLHLTRVAYWRDARVIAALAAEPPAAALQLAEELRRRCRALGLVPDEKPLRPHVTLMRVAARQWRHAGADAARAVPVDLTLPAAEFQLFESRDPARGAVVGGRYVSLARWPLRP